jgi:hypothetical protein
VPTPPSLAPNSGPGNTGDDKSKSPPSPSSQSSPPDLVSSLLDRCEVTHFSEIYERWVNARGGAVTLSDLQGFNAIFTLDKVREDIDKHPLLLLAHPPRPANLKVPGGDTWHVVDHRGLKSWIKKIFAIKAEDVGQQVNPANGIKIPGEGAGAPHGLGLMVSLADIQGYLGVGDDQEGKLDLLLERACTLPGVFLRRTQAHGNAVGDARVAGPIADTWNARNAGNAGNADSNAEDRPAPARLIYYQQLSRFRVRAKRRLLYQLLSILVIFTISLYFLLPFLLGL